MILAALAVATITVTISYGSIFKRLRNHDPTGLTHCPYCLAHWFSAAVVLATGQYTGIVDFIIMTFAMVAIASVFSFPLIIYLKWLDRQGDQYA